MPRGLSKSKLLSYRQCPKKLYLEVAHPEWMTISSEQQKIFDTGHAVGECAQTFYPDGVLVEHDFELTKALEATEHLLTNTGITTLFEATFQHEGVLVRADLLHKTTHGLHVQEVKSATKVKDVNIEDCAIQTWVIEGAGYAISDIELQYINNQFVLEEEGVYDGLFASDSLLNAVRDLQPHVGDWVKGAKAVLNLTQAPGIMVGEQCTQPYDCPFIEHCDPPDTEYPVECLPRGTRMAIALRQEGIKDIRDIPAGRLTSETHERVRRVTIKGQYELDPAIAPVLNDIGYPRYYIDFETIAFAIPIWLGTRPYQQNPFQWSCHIEHDDKALEHVEFLDLTGEDPAKAFIDALVRTLGETGPVIVYNKGFENGQLRRLAERYPEHADAINKIIDRVVDLLPIARDYYYHPAMHGSWSIKSVLPTIAPELNYAELDEVHHGGEAQMAFLEAIHPETDDARKQLLDKHLRAYCGLDTYAMVKILHFFEANA